MNYYGIPRAVENEAVYIAGPEVFYFNGQKRLGAMRAITESAGMNVTLPNDTVIEPQEDPRKMADAILQNCADSMNESTAIIVDLEDFRGTEPDGGSVYELGMAYARGMRCYAYSRDCRPAVEKDWSSKLTTEGVVDQNGWKLAHPYLPFSPTVMGSAKLIEGDYQDALTAMIADVTYDYVNGRKLELQSKVPPKPAKIATVYVASPLRLSPEAEVLHERLKAAGEKLGLRVLTPLDPVEGESDVGDDPYLEAGNLFRRYVSHVEICDAIIADLDDFHGLEPHPDVSFECGLAYQLGKHLFATMTSTQTMLEHIPNHDEDLDFRDSAGRDVEKFDYPINLMFASTMDIRESSFEPGAMEIMKELARNGN